MSTPPNGHQLPLIIVEEIVRYCLDMHTATNHRVDDASSAGDPSSPETNNDDNDDASSNNDDDDSSSNSSSEFSDVSSSDDANDMPSAVPLLAFDNWNSVFQLKMCKQITVSFARGQPMVYHFPNWPCSFGALDALASLAESEFASFVQAAGSSTLFCRLKFHANVFCKELTQQIDTANIISGLQVLRVPGMSLSLQNIVDILKRALHLCKLVCTIADTTPTVANMAGDELALSVYFKFLEIPDTAYALEEPMLKSIALLAIACPALFCIDGSLDCATQNKQALEGISASELYKSHADRINEIKFK
ncbi:hypothetical protein LPJ66_006596 [Kickxella alabastrina]|uniref:Uncharacterized protein n=1 Tax=Kickxella alabastrina TaxID=61397 RepID=A0ACC1IDK6_9FUNG|nr:hypothetical protein LPJ66_006596 [Kickxella alabastrina]